MKKKSKIWLVSFGCIGIGIILLIVGVLFGGRPGIYIDKKGVHGANTKNHTPHTQEKIKLDEFSNIDIRLSYADLEIVPSDGYYIEYSLDGYYPEPVLEVSNKELRFKEGSASGFTSYNFFVFEPLVPPSHTYYVKLYVPDDQHFSNIKLTNNDGEVKLGDIQANTLDINNEYGQVELESFQGENFKADMNDGTFMINSLVSENVDISNEYGKCELGSVKAGSMNIAMDDGAFIINKLISENVDISNEYGKCEFGSVKAGNMKAALNDSDFTVESFKANYLKVDSEYGDVEIGLTEKAEKYELDLLTEYGNIEIPGYPEFSTGGSDEKIFRSNNGAKNKIIIKCDDGDIIITEDM